MKRKNKTKILIIILVIIILIITLCFLYTLFKLETLRMKKSNFKIEYTNINKINPIKAGNFEPIGKASITNNGLSLNMSFDLYSPNDEITYDVTIKNTGDIKGKIVNVIEVPDYATNDNIYKLIYPATISTSNIIGEELAPGEEVIMKVTASYSKVNGKTNPINIPYQLSLLTTTS